MKKGTVEGQWGDTIQEKENEKEKRSKREKVKEKEINKNGRRCVTHARNIL